MVDDQSHYLAGRLLVAMPGIGDPRFERAVILLCAHDDDHAMGLAINRPVEGLTVASLLGQLGVTAEDGAATAAVLQGGPVQPERGFVLHTRDHKPDSEGSAVDDDLMLTASREILEVLAKPRGKPRKALMAVGYAGWDAGQLEREIKDNIWLTCEPDDALVFGEDHARKWERALAKIGVSAASLSTLPGRA